MWGPVLYLINIYCFPPEAVMTASLINIGGFAAVVKCYFFATTISDRRFDVATLQHKLMFVQSIVVNGD